MSSFRAYYKKKKKWLLNLELAYLMSYKNFKRRVIILKYYKFSSAF